MIAALSVHDNLQVYLYVIIQRRIRQGAKMAIRSTIENWIYRSFSDVKSYKDGSELRVMCPICKQDGHGPDTDYHLHISLVKEVAHCFRCDFGTRSYTHLISKVEGCSYSEALLVLGNARDEIIPLYILRRKEKESSIVSQFPTHVVGRDFLTIRDAITKGGLAARHAIRAAEYIKKRLSGICPWQFYLDVWGVFPGADGYGKLVFPVEDGWWQYRHISAGYTGPKYVSCSRPKEHTLYNAQALRIHDTVYVAEGIISAAAVGLNCVALCGKKATPRQLARLGTVRRVKTYVLCLDANTTEESLWLARALRRYGKKITLRTYDKGDPASSRYYKEIQHCFSSEVARRLAQR